jgi:hypothetical protein
VDPKRSRFLDDIPEVLANDTPTPAAKSNLWRSEGGGEKCSPSKSTTVKVCGEAVQCGIVQ